MFVSDLADVDNDGGAGGKMVAVAVAVVVAVAVIVAFMKMVAIALMKMVGRLNDVNIAGLVWLCTKLPCKPNSNGISFEFVYRYKKGQLYSKT